MTRNRALNNELAKHGLPHLRRYLRSSLPRARFGLPVVNRLQTAPPIQTPLSNPYSISAGAGFGESQIERGVTLSCCLEPA